MKKQKKNKKRKQKWKQNKIKKTLKLTYKPNRVLIISNVGPMLVLFEGAS